MSRAPLDRRRFIVGAGALAVMGYAGVRSGWFTGWLTGLLPQQPLPFQDMVEPAGYRRLSGGEISGGFDPLIGIPEDTPEGLVVAERVVARDICAALFGQSTGTAGQVPMAYFFDYQCPICRRLTPRLRALKGVALNWHDLAALGVGSKMAARAAIAARNQGAYDAFHDRLMRSRFQANEGYVGLLAQSVGIDGARLLADMNSPQVNDQMWQSRAVANMFGMLGTPGMVIGRTVIIGDISDRDLARIVADEAVRGGYCG
ncbi:MAG: DsbA family protein [Paracoccaceae bacterium]